MRLWILKITGHWGEREVLLVEPRLATTTLKDSLLIFLTQEFLQRQLTQTHVVHPILPL